MRLIPIEVQNPQFMHLNKGPRSDCSEPVGHLHLNIRKYWRDAGRTQLQVELSNSGFYNCDFNNQGNMENKVHAFMQSQQEI